MQDTVRESVGDFVSSEKLPLKSDVTPMVVLLKKILAKGIGCFVSASITFPIIFVTCPNRGAEKSTRNKRKQIDLISFFLNIRLRE